MGANIETFLTFAVVIIFIAVKYYMNKRYERTLTPEQLQERKNQIKQQMTEDFERSTRDMVNNPIYRDRPCNVWYNNQK